MAAMKWSLLLVFAGGCADRVEVRVKVPEAYREGVASLILHVLEPPETEPFGCDEIALDDVLPGALELSETWLASLDEPGGEYLRLDRRADKRLWVEGVDGTGSPLVEGCAELDYVGADRVVTIELEPTVILDLFGDAAQLNAVLRDYRGEPRAGATVSWRRVEPGGLITTGAAVTDARGHTPVAVQPGTRSGPSLLEFMVRWSRTGKTIFQGFGIPPVLGPIPFAKVLSSATGRIAPDGGHAGVGIFDACGGVPDDWGKALVSVSNTGELTVQQLEGCTAGGAAPAVAIRPVSPDRDQIVALNGTTWWTLDLSRNGPDLQIQSHSGPVSPSMLVPPRVLYPVGACDGAADEFLAVTGGGLALGVYRVPAQTGAAAVRVASGPFTSISRLVGGAGCVSDGAGGERRVVLTHTLAGQRSMIVADVAGPGACHYDWDSGPPLATPTVASSAGVEHHLVYTVVKAGVGDLEVQAARLDLAGGGCRPLVVVRESPPALPVVMQSGDLDGDGLLDLVGVVGSIAVEDGRFIFVERVWASLGVEHNGRRLTGTSVPLGDLLVTELAIYDADGDGLDDVMMIADQSNNPNADPVALGVLMGMPPR